MIDMKAKRGSVLFLLKKNVLLLIVETKTTTTTTKIKQEQKHTNNKEANITKQKTGFFFKGLSKKNT